MRCDCEQVECGHRPGDCKRTASHRVEAYELKEKLCDVCLGIALAFCEEGEIQIDEGLLAQGSPSL